MPRYRFSIRGMMIVVLLLAMAFAGLRTPTRLWANVWYSMALFGIAIAIPLAVAERDGRRLFWIGFAVCGWVYYLVALAPWIEEQTSYRLATTTVLDVISPGVVDNHYLERIYIRSFTSPAPTTPPTPWQVWNLAEPHAATWRHGYATLHAPFLFFRIGHSAFCLIFAMLAGELTRYIGTRNSDRSGAGTSRHPGAWQTADAVPFLLPDGPARVASTQSDGAPAPAPPPSSDRQVRI
ncbi:MAG: hypothetical protein ACYC61_06835 [Isosphaeraceae bacterium]